jgi:hypothetical protein
MGGVVAGVGGKVAGAFEIQRQADGVDLRHNSDCVHNFPFDCGTICGQVDSD